MKLKIAPINHDVIHATDAETIAKLKKTIAGLKGENTKLLNANELIVNEINKLKKDNENRRIGWDFQHSQIENLKLDNDFLKETNNKCLDKIAELENILCVRDDKYTHKHNVIELELLNIIKKQAEYIINSISK